MKEKLKIVIRFIMFLGIGVFLFWLVYRDQPIDQIIKALNGANYFYIWLSLFISLLSHISRALRWNILIISLGYKPRPINTFLSVMVMYLSNTAIPRSGEVVRCGIIKKYEKIPITKLFGTVIVERTVDFIMLLILLIIVIITQFDIISNFIANNPEFGLKFSSPGQKKLLIIIGIFIGLIAVVIFLLRNRFKNSILVKKIKELSGNLIEGVKTIKNLKRKWEFIFHTVFIWTMYFIMIYLVFKSFGFTNHLNLMSGLTVFVMSSLGMLAPSPGGIGTWHFMVIETLIIYGVQKYPDANAFAFAAHGSMTLFLVFTGFISLIILPLINKKNKEIAD